MGVHGNFSVEASKELRGTVLTVTGELDLASSPALEQELQRAREGGAELVVVDLRELEFMDSTGLNVLVKAHHEAQESGRRFGLVRGTAQVQRLLSLTGLEDRLIIVDAPEELLSVG
jgi:anti-anti-sigma factor